MTAHWQFYASSTKDLIFGYSGSLVWDNLQQFKKGSLEVFFPDFGCRWPRVGGGSSRVGIDTCRLGRRSTIWLRVLFIGRVLLSGIFSGSETVPEPAIVVTGGIGGPLFPRLVSHCFYFIPSLLLLTSLHDVDLDVVDDSWYLSKSLFLNFYIYCSLLLAAPVVTGAGSYLLITTTTTTIINIINTSSNGGGGSTTRMTRHDTSTAQR